MQHELGLVQLHQNAALPQSALGAALHYTASQWEKLTRYVKNGSWPIDNNACENAIRLFVVERNVQRYACPRTGQREPVLVAADLPGHRREHLRVPQGSLRGA